jgi:hypothetical protein
MTDRDDRIRELAYFLWLDEGSPEGQAERHWQAAESLFDSQSLERKRVKGEPAGDPLDHSQAASGSPGASQILRRRGVPSGKD